MKKILLILGLALMVLVSGCTSGSNARQNGYNLGESFNGGSDALTFTFGDEAPPAKVRDQSLQPFSVRLLVENLGEYDIPENSAYVTLTGFNPADLGMTSTSKPLGQLRGFKLQGSNLIPGGKQQVVFDNLKYVESAVSGSFPLTMYANICYPYETKAFALLCINGNTVPALDKKAEICSLEGDKPFANSGAPVTIANVKQYPFGESSIQVQFDIVHTPTSPNANVYESGSIDSQCQVGGVAPSSSDALFARDKVTYTVASGIAGLNCEGTGTNTNTVTLTANTYTVTCVQDTTGQSEYEKPISIVLKYDYLDRQAKVVEVEHIQR